MSKKKSVKGFEGMMAPKKNMLSAQDNTKSYAQNSSNLNSTAGRAKRNMTRKAK